MYIKETDQKRKTNGMSSLPQVCFNVLNQATLSEFHKFIWPISNAMDKFGIKYFLFFLRGNFVADFRFPDFQVVTTYHR